MRFDLPDAYWKKDVALFFSRRFSLIIKMLYPIAIIVPVAVSGMPAKYAAAVIGIVAIMAGTFGAGESLTIDLNDGILVRVALTPLSPYRIVFEVLAVNAVLDLVQLLPALLIVYLLHPVSIVWMLAATLAVFATLVTANCIGIFIANFTSSPADVLLYATAILFDAMKTVFGLATTTTPLEILIYPNIICAALAFAVCLTAPRLLSQRL